MRAIIQPRKHVGQADQRYYSSAPGRFLTPDPYIASAGLSNPQTWNRYTYADHDPISRIDPSGLVSDGSDQQEQRSTCVGFQPFGYVPAGTRGPNDCITIPVPWLLAAFQLIHDAKFDSRVALASRTLGGMAGLIYEWEAADDVASSFELEVPSDVFLEANNLAPAVGVVVIGWKAGSVLVIAGAAFLYDFVQWLRKPGILPDDCPQDQRQATPTTMPGQFDPVRGSPCSVDPNTGEIWCPDQLHKDHWEVYKKRKDYENGNRDREVWNSGCLRRKF